MSNNKSCLCLTGKKPKPDPRLQSDCANHLWKWIFFAVCGQRRGIHHVFSTEQEASHIDVADVRFSLCVYWNVGVSSIKNVKCFAGCKVSNMQRKRNYPRDSSSSLTYWADGHKCLPVASDTGLVLVLHFSSEHFLEKKKTKQWNIPFAGSRLFSVNTDKLYCYNSVLSEWSTLLLRSEWGRRIGQRRGVWMLNAGFGRIIRGLHRIKRDSGDNAKQNVSVPLGQNSNTLTNIVSTHTLTRTYKMIYFLKHDRKESSWKKQQRLLFRDGLLCRYKHTLKQEWPWVFQCKKPCRKDMTANVDGWRRKDKKTRILVNGQELTDGRRGVRRTFLRRGWKLRPESLKKEHLIGEGKNKEIQSKTSIWASCF